MYEGDNSNTGRDNSWLIRSNTTDYWEILVRKHSIVYGSDQQVRFNNLNFKETFSSETLKPLDDSLTVLKINGQTNDSSVPLLKTISSMHTDTTFTTMDTQIRTKSELH